MQWSNLKHEYVCVYSARSLSASLSLSLVLSKRVCVLFYCSSMCFCCRSNTNFHIDELVENVVSLRILPMANVDQFLKSKLTFDSIASLNFFSLFCLSISLRCLCVCVQFVSCINFEWIFLSPFYSHLGSYPQYRNLANENSCEWQFSFSVLIPHCEFSFPWQKE